MASLSACASRRATLSSSSVAGCTRQLSRGCAQTLELCTHIGSHALPGACPCITVPARRPPASVSLAGVLLAGSNLSQPRSLRTEMWAKATPCGRVTPQACACSKSLVSGRRVLCISLAEKIRVMTAHLTGRNMPRAHVRHPQNAKAHPRDGVPHNTGAHCMQI